MGCQLTFFWRQLSLMAGLLVLAVRPILAEGPGSATLPEKIRFNRDVYALPGSRRNPALIASVRSCQTRPECASGTRCRPVASSACAGKFAH